LRAQIVKNDKREFYCLEENGQEVLRATALAKFLKGDAVLVVGDWVRLEKNRDEYHIAELEERKNSIYRRLVRENSIKVQAANIDLIVLVASLSKPPFRQGLVDRYLLRAFDWGIPVVLVLNKFDQYDAKTSDFDLSFEIDRLRPLGLPIFILSAKNPDLASSLSEVGGFKDLKSRLRGKLAFFTGQSGVGKSEMINALAEREVPLRTHEISKVGKGSHTTTWSEIVQGGDFRIVDSPGIKSYAIDDIVQDICIELFPDLFQFARLCQYSNCQHTPDIDGCALMKEIDRRGREEGERSAELLQSRLDSFHKIFSECAG
jgi:ribosome biogenesis GTPase / thiamine phosphate phosphatase